MISSAIQHCPKEILIELSRYLNTIYPQIKDQILKHCAEGYTIKQKDKVWETNTGIILEILHPLAKVVNTKENHLLQVPVEEIVKFSDNTMKDVVPMDSVTPSNTLNHAIKTYAQCRSAEKKIAKYISPSL